MTPEQVVPEVIGWRAWKIVGNEQLPMLGSVSHPDVIWHPDRWTLAVCGEELTCPRSSDGKPPGERCHCGLYSAKTRAQLLQLGYPVGSEMHPVLIGEVGMSGKVIPGSQGWKAQRSRIVRLLVPHAHYRFAKPLEELYRVPIEFANTLR